MILIDTTIIIDYIRGDKKVLEFLEGSTSAYISLITQAEIYQGARNKEEFRKWDKSLVNFTILPVTEKISQKAVELLKEYHLSHGLLILDAFIAATAIDYKSKLITANLKHFQMIEGLELIPWPPKL